MTVPHRTLLILLLVPALLAVPGPLRAGGHVVKVVATVPNLASIAASIGGDRVKVMSIATGTQDAHFVDPKPSFIVKLRAADLLLVNGLDLEIGWVPPLTQGARTGRLIPGGDGYIDCSTGIRVVEVPTILSRAEGDVHPYGNPHYLTDPLNAEIVAATITEALTRVDPEGAAGYEAGRKAFVRALHEAMFGKELVDLVGGSKLAREAANGTLDGFLNGTSIGGATLMSRLGGWMKRMQAVRGQPLVTYHKDLSYFADRFGIRVVDYVEPKPGIQPTAKHLEELVGRLKQGEARVIIVRPFNEHRSTDFLQEKTGVTVITLPLETGGDPAATDYLKLYDLVTSRIAAALAGAGAGAAPAQGR
jgi:zinc/manganese transport system substrate-binding protein